MEHPNVDFLIRVKQDCSAMREIGKLPMMDKIGKLDNAGEKFTNSFSIVIENNLIVKNALKLFAKIIYCAKIIMFV